MAHTKRYWRWKMAERLATRKRRMEGRNADEATYEEIEEANNLVWRLCRLANDNERNAERDNDSTWQETPRLKAKLDRIEERWIEREREISSLFESEYGCKVDWPGCYPTVYAINDERFGPDAGMLDICEMY